MENPELEKLKFPIGQFTAPEPVTEEHLKNYISDIENFPGELKALVSGITENQLNTCYRENGWTVKQVIHHIADSHMNAYIRFKLALTEDMPTVRPHFEDKWAELGDYSSTPPEVSLILIEALHRRWTDLLRSMSKKDFESIFFHPEHGQEFSLAEIAGMYAWHGKHHYAHINELKKRMKW
jgi:hypothetical protein